MNIYLEIEKHPKAVHQRQNQNWFGKISVRQQHSTKQMTGKEQNWKNIAAYTLEMQIKMRYGAFLSSISGQRANEGVTLSIFL